MPDPTSASAPPPTSPSPSQGAPPATPSQGAPAVSDPVKEAIEAARRATEASTRAASQMADTTRRITEAITRRAADPPPKPAEPLSEEDAELTAKLDKRLEEKLKETFGTINETYTRDLTAQLEFRKRQEIERLSAHYTAMGFPDLADQVKDYIKDLDPRSAAEPSLLEDAFRVMIARRVEKERMETLRTAPIASTSRSASDLDRSSTPTLGAEERAWMRETLGVSMTDKEYALLSQKRRSFESGATGICTLNDYLAAQETKS